MLVGPSRSRTAVVAAAFPWLLLTCLSGVGCGEGGKPVGDAGAPVDAQGDAAGDADQVPPAALRINELCPDNDGLTIDEVGQADDFIELYNADSAPVDLAGWVLSEGKKK